MPSIHDLEFVERRARELRVDPHELRLLRNAYYKKHRSADDALAVLSDDVRARFADGLEFGTLELVERVDSRVDGATKLLFRTTKGYLIESVILRFEKGRTALCVSSQVGCAANCSFCATATMGIVRDLTPVEILDQLTHANRLLAAEDRSVRNVVFMGMGEPLHNEDSVYRAVEVLISPRCFAQTPRRVVVSTVGIPDAMVRCAERFPEVRIALSLHSARPEVREKLVPLSRVYDLDALHRAMEEVTARQGQPVMVEYLMLDRVNDGAEDLTALADYLRGIPVHINLIPYNTFDGAGGLQGTPRERREAFGAELRDAGFTVTLRYSLGVDIEAACGQLARRENRRVGGPGTRRT